MKCITPMYRIYNTHDPDVTGHVISRQKAAELLMKKHNYSDYKNALFADLGGYNALQTIPCGYCWACQLNYSAQWATRIMLEAKNSPHNYFITLTYDDVHLPIAEKIEADGVTYDNDGTWGGCLYEQHAKKFINSLRKYFHEKGHDGIKYLYCGEYGETTHRPHFHMVLLNCPLDPLKFHDPHVDKNFKAHWKSEEIEYYWGEEFRDENGTRRMTQYGMVDVCELEWSCAAYVARYCTKKISFDRDKTQYYKIGKMPEFIRMSKGIAFQWYREHKDDIYKTDSIIMKTVKGNVGSAKPPKAFDRKLKDNNPELYEAIKQSRRTAAERAEAIRKGRSDYTELDNLIMAAEKVKTKMQMLPRVGEW